MSSIQRVCAISIFFGLFGAVTACGSDDDKGGGAEGCKQVCDKQAAAKCPSPGGITITTDDCKQFCDAFAQISTACKDALKAESDCQLKLSDICSDTGCQTQEDAVGQACTK
jgi:hypothetical protein